MPFLRLPPLALGLLLAALALPAAAQLPRPSEVPTPAPAVEGVLAQPDPAPPLDDDALLLVEIEEAVVEGRFDIDPWEGFNRRVHNFNKGVDRAVARPLAVAYVRVVPEPVRNGVRNFFGNLFQPLTAVHLLLQGHPGPAGAAAGRFLVNVTLGVGGLFDPATHFGIPRYEEDLGQTLAVWGWDRSRYLVLPFLGPRTVRDAFGAAGDGLATPYQFVESDKARFALIGLSLVDLRVQLFAVDELTQGVEDDYILTREGWLQRRNYMINDRANPVPGRVIRHIPGLRDRVQPSGQTDPSLPDYLDELFPDEEGFEGAPAPTGRED
ncbi:VacJ family lipoprotein [Coralloluteibacterium thermophilus]|uniref:VacJ family lipoprotein n=1 Tax=Coralloluteibacterium thermophilum TaxID=2707049 RepID=A0ABV9NN08_9GAMM